MVRQQSVEQDELRSSVECILCQVKSTPSVNGREKFARLIFINRILDELAHLTRYFIVSEQLV